MIMRFTTLRIVMNEVFGEENFVANCQSGRSGQLVQEHVGGFSTDHDYVLCFAKDRSSFRLLAISCRGPKTTAQLLEP